MGSGMDIQTVFEQIERMRKTTESLEQRITRIEEALDLPKHAEIKDGERPHERPGELH